jgi:hypothetical protein
VPVCAVAHDSAVAVALACRQSVKSFCGPQALFLVFAKSNLFMLMLRSFFSMSALRVSSLRLSSFR